MMDTPLVLFRLDATSQIGSGHAMRCRSIADALNDVGARVAFVVGTQESADFLSGLGLDSHVINGDPMRLGREDGAALGRYANDINARVIFVDTYGVTPEFFKGLGTCGARIAYLDDLYTFELGRLDSPVRWPVSLVLNYSFYADEDAYRNVYEGDVRFALGPGYAPLGKNFKGRRARAGRMVRDIMVTTGSTNPKGTLELMTKACLSACDATIHVVVGAKSTFDIDAFHANAAGENHLDILHNISDMASLMERCDMAVSAGGTTLYELCAMGMPTVAMPIVDNQQQNVESFGVRGLGVALPGNISLSAVLSAIRTLTVDSKTREDLSVRMRECVSGNGCDLIAESLLADFTKARESGTGH